MKHSIIYSILLAGIVALGALPFPVYDVGSLHPVQTVMVAEERGEVALFADTGDYGSGENWEAAVENMEKTADGTIFQGTVTFIILEDEKLLREVLDNTALSPNCVVCLGENISDLEAAGKFLAAHKPETSLISLRAETKPLPVLRENEGRFELHGGET